MTVVKFPATTINQFGFSFDVFLKDIAMQSIIIF